MAARNRKGGVVQVNYLVLVQDIKPWPPSQSLRSLRSVMIQWENGEKSSGSTNTVVPTLGSVVGEGKIEFNEPFRLPVSLVRESMRGRDMDTFQKNCLEFNLYEPRRDKAQLVASAIVDLADYGIVKETLSISVPMNCKRSFKNTDQPVLSIKIEPVVKGRTNSSTKGGLLKDASLDRNGSGSVSSLMNEEYLEEAEIASFTDDDVSSQSSMNASPSTLESNGGLPPQLEAQENSKGTAQGMAQENLNDRPSQLASTGISSDLESIANGSLENNSVNSSQLFQEKAARNGMSGRGEIHREETVSNHLEFQAVSPICNDSFLKLASTAADGYHISADVDSDYMSEIDHERQRVDESSYSSNGESSNVYMQEVSKDNPLIEKDSPHPDRGDRLKHVKSVRSPSDSVRSNGPSSYQHTETREGGILGEVQSGGSLRSSERKDAKVYPKDSRSAILDNKIQQLEQKLKMLEGELREAAALEAALYSVVAEHGSSISKVHAPARRLSRLYLHAYREGFQLRRASVSRSIVSGLILVAKACGNDVPRLTFWLSNSVVFRALIWQTVGIGDAKITHFSGLMEKNVARKGKKEVSPQLKWEDSSSKRKENNNVSSGSLSDWEESHTFISALERVEGWIFSRVIESVWWQTLTPHMQLAIGKAVDRDAGSCSIRKSGRVPSSTDQEQGNFSLEHWKKAFKDACERLCPVRAGGHECGCLPMLARLIMEQCVARLDVAMFNALLRESSDEMPTDPVSDPISNSAVLPIPAGKASFGAGAQLKNAIGNWSRWLSNLFGIEDDENPEDENDDERLETSFKPFHLLNALSDLMMLPKDMLLDGAIRKEVCPTFGAALIKKILHNFVPDEFCPDPVPGAVLEALDEEDPFEAREGSVTNHPCAAPPSTYSPPSAASVSGIIGESGSQSKLKRTGSLVVRKSYTSDDELDELNSPLCSILADGLRNLHGQLKPSWISKGDSNPCAIRYELLRDVWKSSE